MAVPENCARPVLVQDCSSKAVDSLTKRSGEVNRSSFVAAMTRTFFPGCSKFLKLTDAAPVCLISCPLKKRRYGWDKAGGTSADVPGGTSTRYHRVSTGLDALSGA